MEYKKVQEIIKNFEKSELTFLELETKSLKIKLSKNKNENSVVVQEEILNTKKQEEKENKTPVEVVEENKGFEVKSPLVGTFYSGSSPSAEPFVKVNQKVEKGQTLCIIEAMKIMNEIVAPVSGVVSSIKVSNASPVGFDQVLMTIV